MSHFIRIVCLADGDNLPEDLAFLTPIAVRFVPKYPNDSTNHETLVEIAYIDTELNRVK